MCSSADSFILSPSVATFAVVSTTPTFLPSAASRWRIRSPTRAFAFIHRLERPVLRPYSYYLGVIAFLNEQYDVVRTSVQPHLAHLSLRHRLSESCFAHLSIAIASILVIESAPRQLVALAHDSDCAQAHPHLPHPHSPHARRPAFASPPQHIQPSQSHLRSVRASLPRRRCQEI